MLGVKLSETTRWFQGNTVTYDILLFTCFKFYVAINWHLVGPNFCHSCKTVMHAVNNKYTRNRSMEPKLICKLQSHYTYII